MNSFRTLTCTYILALAILIPAPRASAAFGVTSSGGYYTVDSGAGLVFDVDQSGGDITRIVYNGIILQEDADYGASQLISGIGAESVTATNISGQYIKITLQTASDNSVVSNLTHYIMVKNGENKIHMATYAEDSPSVGELRWITRLRTPKLPNGPAPSDLRGNTGAIESSDVFGMADGTTRSKYYGDDITHGKDRAMDMTYCGATGDGIGVWMVYGSRESSAGGPFYRDIQNQYGSSQQEIYNYMFSGHAKLTTVDWRLGVLHGPYTLVFNDGSEPVYPIDYSWIDTGGLNLTGFVPDADRGTVSGTVSGIQDGFETVVGFSNTEAQYWATATNGSYTSPLMKPGTYDVTLYQQELEVATSSATVSAGGNTTKNLTAASQPSILWRLGQRDGTPAGLLNADKVIEMHMSDVRMDSWTTAGSSTPYVVGGSTPVSEGLPCYQWKDITSQYVKFDLTAAQASVNSTIRIGITASQSARVGIEIGGLSTYTSTYPTGFDYNSRSITLGTWRGGNYQATFSVNSSYLSSGSNTLRINAVSGSGGTGYLSPGFSIDYIEMSGPVSTAPPPTPTGLAAAPRAYGAEVSWNAVDWAEAYVLERATASNGTYTVLSSNIGPAYYTDNDADIETTYYYRVSAVNSAGTGPVSSPVSTLPETPTELTASAVSSSRINLTWTDASGAESYTVKRSGSSGGPYTTIASNVAATGYADIGLAEGTTSFYVVSSVNTAGESDNTDEATATTYAHRVLNVATDSGSGVSSSTLENFALNGGNSLVVLISGEGPDSSPNHSVTYGGQPVTAKVTANEGAQKASVFYWLNPPITNGDVVVTFDGNTLYAVSALSLDNALALNDSGTFGEPEANMPYDIAYDGTASGIMAASFVDNDYDGGADLSITGDNVVDYLQRIGGNGSESAGRAHAYGSIALDGSFTTTFTEGGTADSSRNAGALAAFSLDPDTTAPEAPGGLTISAGDAAVALDWNDNSEPDMANYAVYRSTTPGSGYGAIATGLTSSTYLDAAAINGTTYFYVVTAIDSSNNESTNSMEVSATPAPQPPLAPTGLLAVSGDSTIHLDWNDNSETNLTGYRLYRSTVSGSGYAAIATVTGSSDYSDTNAFAGATYYYVVTAVNDSALESAASAESSAIAGRKTTISVANSTSAAGKNAAVSSSTFSNFNLQGGNALVVLLSLEGGNPPAPTVTFDGDSVTDVVFANYNNQAAAIYYWIDPPVSSGDVVVSFAANNGYGVSVMSLDHVANIADSDSYSAGSGTASWNLDYNGTEGGFVVGAMADNNDVASAPTISGDYIDSYQLQVNSATYSVGMAHAYGGIDSEGAFSETFTNSGGLSTSSRNAGVLAAFNAALSYDPTAPASLSAAAVSSDQIDLSWATSDADSYTVKRSLSMGGPYTDIATGIMGASYSDTGLNENTTYYYVVTATNAYGESDSSEANATTFITTYPTMDISFSNGTVILSWPSNYSGWQLEYQTNLMSTNAWIIIPDSELTNLINYGTVSNDVIFFRLVNP